MRMETPHSKAHGVGYMGICHGDDPAVTCKRCGILCCYIGPQRQGRCWQSRFGDDKVKGTCMEIKPEGYYTNS